MACSSPHREASPVPGAKETGPGKDVLEDDGPEGRGGAEATPGRASRSARKGEAATPGEPPMATASLPLPLTLPVLAEALSDPGQGLPPLRSRPAGKPSPVSLRALPCSCSPRSSEHATQRAALGALVFPLLGPSPNLQPLCDLHSRDMAFPALSMAERRHTLSQRPQPHPSSLLD